MSMECFDCFEPPSLPFLAFVLCPGNESNADEFIPKLIALNQQGRFPYDQLIKFYDFADINEAISDAENGRVLKPVIRFNGG